MSVRVPVRTSVWVSTVLTPSLSCLTPAVRRPSSVNHAWISPVTTINMSLPLMTSPATVMRYAATDSTWASGNVMMEIVLTKMDAAPLAA